MSSFAIIIPCYNEARRIDVAQFINFANLHGNVRLIFVNDGSTDDTLMHLEKIKKKATNISVISYSDNKGKAAAIHEGLRYALSLPVEFAGYLDADLSTSLEEIKSLFEFAQTRNVDIVLGSRIKKIDTKIERNPVRHLIGRIIATIIDQKFQLGIYDTQCGAKVFKAALIKNIIQEKFRTKWFADVELLVRIRKTANTFHAVEVPLQSWIDKKQSKLTILSGPQVIKDLAYLVFVL